MALRRISVIEQPKETLTIPETAGTFPLVIKLYADGRATLLQHGDIIVLSRDTLMALNDFLFNRVTA